MTEALEMLVEAEELLEWATYLEDTPRRSGRALARAINQVGENTLRKVVDQIAQDTGVDSNTIAHMMFVKQATPNDLTWSLDASQIVPPSMDWSRPWATPRGDVGDSFQNQALVKIVTCGDEHVCEYCQRMAEEGPYTLEQALKFQHKYDATGYLHPHCRCAIKAWDSTRRLPVTLGTSPKEFMSMKDLADAIKDELRVTFKVT